jgi:hypothetical protein
MDSNRPALAPSPLQGDAWAAWNASYHESNAEAYRALASALYRQDLWERIAVQLSLLDEQNALLDALLATAGHRTPTAA